MSPLLVEDARGLVARIVARRPRIHALTNPVALAITANVLVALGAEPSMSTHPRDIPTLMGSADAVLVNLGMLEPDREAAIEVLLADAGLRDRPVVLDPVMADRVPFRKELAERFEPFSRLIVKGNVAEMATLCLSYAPEATLVTTSKTDWVEQGNRRIEIGGGSPLMERFSASGCITGAVLAAFSSVERDPVRAASAGLATLRFAAEKAGTWANGPGTFVPHLLDEIARFSGK